MTVIKARCPCCGDVEMRPDAVELDVVAPPATSSYAFVCPRCCVRVVKPADDYVVTLLVSGGVVVRTMTTPMYERHDGPPLSIDDLLDLILALRDATYLSDLASLPQERT